MAGDTCDVCGTKEDIVGVASSSFGAISFCFCRKCIVQNAEPVSMFEYLYQEIGEEVAEHVQYAKTFKDGRYISWNEFVEEKKSCK